MVDRVNVLGIGVSAISLSQAVDHLAAWIADSARQAHYVCCADAHSIMEGYRDPDLRRVYNHADLLTPDGIPLVWLCHAAGYDQVTRVYGPDLLLAACQHGLSLGWRHYFYGGSQETLDHLTFNLLTRFPDLQIVGTDSPPFRALTPV
ncbi:MAG: WecB/TagA/CpsF family glycosyltransferase, partial [Anaerolineae bacterium]